MLNFLAEFRQISPDTIITLCICGGIIALCIFLMILMRKREPKDDRILTKHQCEIAVHKLDEMKKTVESSDFIANGKLKINKLVKVLNYAKRLANQVVYDSENSVSAGILDNVSNAREVAVKIKKGEGVEVCLKKIGYCQDVLNNAIKIVNDLLEADKQINRK